MPEESKMCLSCARARLSGKPSTGCADCALLNVDRFAKIRANAAKPSPLRRYKFPSTYTALHLSGSASTHEHIPARATRGGPRE